MIAVCGGVCSVPLYPQTFFSPPPTDQNLPTNGSTRQSSFFFTAIVSVMTRSFDGGCDQFNSFFASEKKKVSHDNRTATGNPGKEREGGRERAEEKEHLAQTNQRNQPGTGIRLRQILGPAPRTWSTSGGAEPEGRKLFATRAETERTKPGIGTRAEPETKANRKGQRDIAKRKGRGRRLKYTREVRRRWNFRFGTGG